MKKTVTTKPVKVRRKYDDAFRQQALQMIRLGQSVPTVAQALGISEGILYKWKRAERPSDVDQELEQLRQKLKQVETERDILKKALSIFSRPT
ncbi:MAG TPA: transposase [Blastocatellia bacterium]|nr:transposase [Blastocatellia bacterium]